MCVSYEIRFLVVCFVYIIYMVINILNSYRYGVYKQNMFLINKNRKVTLNYHSKVCKFYPCTPGIHHAISEILKQRFIDLHTSVILFFNLWSQETTNFRIIFNRS